MTRGRCGSLLPSPCGTSTRYLSPATGASETKTTLSRPGHHPPRGGVVPAVAQKLLRHSDIRLTMNIYTHLDLADTADAVAALPAV